MVLNRAALLQACCGEAYAGPICSEHGGEKIMSHRQLGRLHSVFGHEQPAGEPLFPIVQSIAGGRVRHLHPLQDRVPAEAHLEIGC